MINLAPFRKLIVAILVPVVGYGIQWFGLDIEWGEEQAHSLINLLVPVLTAFGVWQATNTPLPEKQ